MPSDSTQRTRHNVGARAVAGSGDTARACARRPGLIPIPMSRSGLVLPDGFMNDSGGSCYKAVERWRPMAEGLLLVHDDMDLALGEVREKEGGGHGGHNGLRDVIARLGSGAFRRLRIGIGRPTAEPTRPTTCWRRFGPKNASRSRTRSTRRPSSSLKFVQNRAITGCGAVGMVVDAPRHDDHRDRGQPVDRSSAEVRQRRPLHGRAASSEHLSAPVQAMIAAPT